MAESDFSDPQADRGGIALYDAPSASAPAFARGERGAIPVSAERDATAPAAEPESDMCANCRNYRYRMIDPRRCAGRRPPAR